MWFQITIKNRVLRFKIVIWNHFVLIPPQHCTCVASVDHRKMSFTMVLSGKELFSKKLPFRMESRRLQGHRHDQRFRSAPLWCAINVIGYPQTSHWREFAISERFANHSRQVGMSRRLSCRLQSVQIFCLMAASASENGQKRLLEQAITIRTIWNNSKKKNLTALKTTKYLIDLYYIFFYIIF